eukprot:6653753-Lingulodinium_polyedra.AAC.1
MLGPVSNGRAPRATPCCREDGRPRGGRIRRLTPECADCRRTADVCLRQNHAMVRRGASPETEAIPRLAQR